MITIIVDQNLDNSIFFSILGNIHVKIKNKFFSEVKKFRSYIKGVSERGDSIDSI